MPKITGIIFDLTWPYLGKGQRIGSFENLFSAPGSEAKDSPPGAGTAAPFGVAGFDQCCRRCQSRFALNGTNRIVCVAHI